MDPTSIIALGERLRGDPRGHFWGGFFGGGPLRLDALKHSCSRKRHQVISAKDNFCHIAGIGIDLANSCLKDTPASFYTFIC